MVQYPFVVAPREFAARRRMRTSKYRYQRLHQELPKSFGKYRTRQCLFSIKIMIKRYPFFSVILVVLLAGCPGKPTEKPSSPSGQTESVAVDEAAKPKAYFSEGKTPTEDELVEIAKQTDLESLRLLRARNMNDSMVESLKGLTQLKTLAITNSGITDAAVKTIAESFPNLVELDLSSNAKLTDKSLTEIAKLKKLQRFSAVLCDFGEFGMLDISKIKTLTVLDIRGNVTIGNTGLDFIATLPKLRVFKHRSQAVDDMGLEVLLQAKNLETLEIQDFSISDQSGESLRQFEKLTFLSVFRCPGFGSEGVLALKEMKLTRLILRGLPSFRDDGMEALKEMTSLRNLLLRELDSVTDEGMKNLAGLTNLEVLFVSDMAITDQTVEVIAKLPNIKDLTIQSTAISDAAVEMILSMPKLERLTLRNNSEVTETGKRKLDTKKFKYLNIKDSGSTESSE